MSYFDFLQKMRLLAKQATVNGVNLASDYERVVTILEAHPNDPVSAENSMREEYEKTQNKLYRMRAQDLHAIHED